MKDPFIELNNALKNASNQLDIDNDIEKLLTPDFMKAHTKFDNVTSWLSNGGFNLTDKMSDEYVKQTTDFNSWEEMLKSAEDKLIKNSFDGLI